MEKTNIAPVIKEIESLISQNFMKIMPDKYVAMVIDGLWNQFTTPNKQHTFIRNLLLYCNLKNAYLGNELGEKKKMQLVVKNSDQKVISTVILEKNEIKFLNL